MLAAGRSERLADPLPKPFRTLAGRRVLDHSLAAFAAAPGIASIVVVVPEGMRDELAPSLLGAPKVVAVVPGGPSRQESLAQGLAGVPPDAAVVVVHDAARPLITAEGIGDVLAAVGGEFDGAIAAIPVDDAIKEVTRGVGIAGPHSREGLWRAQTPQAFLRDCIEASVAKALADGVVCDDCSEMATRAGFRVRVVAGSPRNVKVTRPGDLELCAALLGVAPETPPARAEPKPPVPRGEGG